MPTYRVVLSSVLSTSIDVEAGDEGEAMDLALEGAPSDICAQCSGWGREWDVDQGEWDIAREYQDGRLVEMAPELVED